jgi:hypothetical protein
MERVSLALAEEPGHLPAAETVVLRICLMEMLRLEQACILLLGNGLP